MLPPCKLCRFIPSESPTPPPPPFPLTHTSATNHNAPPTSSSAAAASISDLPEHILHHIISFLPPQSAAKLCLLSTRLRSVWNSAPHLSFENPNIYVKKRTLFLNYIQSTIARRSPAVNLEKLRIYSPLLKLKSDPRVDAAVDYAIDSGVRVLDLELLDLSKLKSVCLSKKYPYYQFPPRILSIGSLSSLRLTGFLLPAALTIGGDSALADLKLSNCVGIESLEISSPGLKSLEIDNCKNLKSLDFDSKSSNLESIRLKSFKPKTPVKLFQDNLKSAELEILSTSTVGVTLKCPRLESLDIRFEHEKYAGEIDLSGCKSLQSLYLTKAKISGEWLERNLRNNFETLKHLKLNSCPQLNNVEVRSESLETLSLVWCLNLWKIDVEAETLKSFEYDFSSRVLHELTLVNSGELLVGVSLNEEMFSKARIDLSTHVLKSLGHSAELKLNVKSIKNLTIPKSSREKKMSPLYDLQYMEVAVDSRAEIVDLVDSLLWLAPHVQVVSLICGSQRKTLKFKYEEGELKGEEEVGFMNCCEPWWPIKCWRHDLREVAMANFEPWEETELDRFFRTNARTYLDQERNQDEMVY